MLKYSRIFKYLFSLNKYPMYLEYFLINIFFLKIWKFKGVDIGKGIIWWGIPIVNQFKGSKISIGEKCVICSRSDQTALGVNHKVIIRTLRANSLLQIGNEVRLSGTTICAADKIIIGNRCVLGANVTIVDTDFHSIDPKIRSSPEDDKSAIHKPVIIEDDVFVGVGTYILKGVTIGKGSIIGAGSVVTKNIPNFTIVAGNPSKIIGKVNLKEIN